MIRYLSVVVFWTLLSTLPFGMASTQVWAQESETQFVTPDWGDYPLLMSQFGEICTMCVAYLQCQPEQSDESVNEYFALYYFETKTFWGQIATIWDYFAKWFDPVTSETRPATIYRFSSEVDRNVRIPPTAYLSVADAKIEIDNTWIDRDTTEWYSASDEKIGSCKRLGIPESTHMVSTNEPWKEQLEQVAAND